jgi:hypothetical protein
MSSYGAGKTLMLGSYLSAAAQSTPGPESERFFAGLLHWAGVTFPVRVSGDSIEARHLDSGGNALVFLFNHGKETARSEVWLERVAGDYAATDLIQDRVVALERRGDGVSVGIVLAPGDVSVLRVSPR